ncbi:MAG: TetR/AcrR family transcriptional regulator [Nevskiaceae bacterium]|jgi:AcrR family transcriptional regulator|nr:MAG: TetR/AcrR family transcriptional regulator [Nevskiaceae bacterium]TAM30421.1 MAG: TetR/AcrR family transcriptional regulator [Nevskiaceae bacterium]
MSDSARPGNKTPSARRPGRPRLRDQGVPATEVILELALEEFGQHGFEGTNINEIAIKAGVAKPLIHYHFETKEKLWQAAVSHAMEKLAAEFRNLNFELKDLEPAAALGVVIRRFTFFCARNHAVTNIVIQEVVRGTERSRWLTETFLKPMFLLAESFLAAAEATGQLRNIHPAHLLSLVQGAINGFFAFSSMLSETYGINPLTEESAAEHAEIVVDILLNGLRVRNGGN